MVENKQEQQWVDVAPDADETTALSEKDPGPIQGIYQGSKMVGSKFGDTALHMIEMKDSDHPNGYILGVWGCGSLDRQIQAVLPGTPIRLTFVGFKDLEDNRRMKVVKVQTPKGSPRAPIKSKGEGQEDLPF